MNLWTVGCADPRLTAQARSLWTSRGKRHAFSPPCPQVGAAHKLHSTPQQDRMNLISGNRETSSRLPALAYSPRKLSKRPAPAQRPDVFNYVKKRDCPLDRCQIATYCAARRFASTRYG